jgi:hypothetical protein
VEVGHIHAVNIDKSAYHQQSHTELVRIPVWHQFGKGQFVRVAHFAKNLKPQAQMSKQTIPSTQAT